MKSQTKIALLFFLFSLSVVLLFSIAIYYFSNRHFDTEFSSRVKIRAVVAARAVLDAEDNRAPGYQEIREKHLEKLPDEKEYFFPVVPGQQLRKEADEMQLPLRFFDDIIAKGQATFRSSNKLFSGLKYTSAKGDYIVVVSASNRYYSEHQAYLQKILIIAILFVSLLTMLISVFFSRRVFNPVHQIIQKVNEISSENMHLRLEGKTYSDEIAELIVTFNNMLDRLETAFETQNNFISNASHELGTPLTAIIGEADVALTKERLPGEYRESLTVILNEAERLDKITKSLLFLAQTGFDGKKQSMQIIRADQLIWDVKETLNRLIPDNKMYVDLSLVPDSPFKLKVKGNAQLLHLALSNIISNACKYSNNNRVQVSIGSSSEHVIIIVKDKGIGIPQQELKFIYDPFFRASNTKHFEGYGIGLPLSRNIIRLHGGTLVVNSVVNEGTTVQVSLPLHEMPQMSVVN